MFATPAGTEIVTLMKRNAEFVELFDLAEWHPMDHPVNRTLILPAALGLTATLFAEIFRWRHLPADWTVAALALRITTLISHRLVVFFAVVSIPVWLHILKSGRDAAGTPTSRRPRLARWTLIGAALTGIGWIGIRCRLRSFFRVTRPVGSVDSSNPADGSLSSGMWITRS